MFAVQLGSAGGVLGGLLLWATWAILEAPGAGLQHGLNGSSIPHC